jgi:ribosome-associated translation inhibitor RaiA
MSTTMKLPLQITFRHLEPSPALEDRIRELAARLGRFSTQIVRCHVIVEAPHQHHQQGALFDFHINLTLPDEEIAIRRAHPADHSHEDPYVALRDAFRAARCKSALASGRAEEPLLLVRRVAADPYTTSLVAVDTPSALSRRALLWGSGLVQGGDCHLVHAYGVPYVERMRLGGTPEAIIDDRMRQAQEVAATKNHELLGAAEGAARLHVHTVCGEPVATVLGEIARHSPQLVVVGNREPQAPRAAYSPMGGVGFRIAYHAPADVLVVS